MTVDQQGRKAPLRPVRWTDEQMREDGWPERIATHAFEAAVAGVWIAGAAAVLWALTTVVSARAFALLSFYALLSAIACCVVLFFALVAMGERNREPR